MSEIVGNPLFTRMPTTVFEVMSRLAQQHDAVNLGQGFPDDRGPADVLEAAADALLNGYNQYPSMWGIPALREAVADHAARFYGIEADWRTEVLVASGATETLAASLLGLIRPGDEVVLFQPLYDCYLPIVRQAGGVPRFVSLKPPHWRFTRADLEAAFGPRTRVVLLNNPLNPAGKVFERAELELIAEFVRRHDAVAVCDEVYEHIVFDGRRHVPLMTLPGMRERCVRIGSAGKTFSLTGWKVGYATAAARLLQPIAKAHQFLTFTTPPNLQAGVAHGLRKDPAYFSGLAGDMQARRDRLAAGLAGAGFGVLPVEGTYFLVADYRPTGFHGSDEEFCRHLIVEAGVAAIPVSAFFSESPVEGYVRFCFCKQDAVLDAAVGRLTAHFARAA